MKKMLVLTTVVLSACSTPAPTVAQPTTPAQAASPTQTAPRAQAPTPPQEQAAPGAAPTSPASAATDPGLNDLNAITFNCAKVGLNAAARDATHKAAEMRAKGSYQFSYFRLVSSSHHSTYEVHFKSNNYEDQDLKYCVDVYCQQGWDPKTANPNVRPLDSAARPARASTAGADHVEECSGHHAHMKQRKKR